MKMFGGILFLIFVSLISVALPRPIFASCSLDQGSRQYSAKYTLTDSGSAQCKAPNNKPNGPYTVWCDTQTEAYAADSVRQPLCGSSEERGKANSTCWSCGGTVKCDGLDFALGATDPFISQIHNPVNPGDTNTDQVWRIPNASIPSTFTYNGMTYNKPGGDLIVCGSNNLACGSSEECTNITYPDINNRGNSESKDQCQNPVGLGADNFTIAEPSCNGNNQPINVLSYVGACGSGECSKSQASVFSKTDSYVNGVVNQVVWTDPNNFSLKTNDKEIKYTIRDGTIYMTEDHTWENEQKCDNGNPAFQKPYTITNGVKTDGIALYKPEMTCGQTVSGKTALEAFDATTGSACTNSIATNSQSQLTTYGVRLIYQGSAVCGGKSENIVAFQNTAGPGTGEVSIYSKGKGLTAWYQGMDFTKGTNAPSNWGPSTDVCSGTFSSIPACAIESKPQTTGRAPIKGAVDFGCHGKLGLTCILDTAQVPILGQAFFANQKFKSFDITRYSNWFMGATDAFTPLSLQKTENGLSEPFKGYASGTLAVDSDVPKPNCYEVKQGVIDFPLPSWNEFVWQADKFNAFLGPYGARPDLNFKRDFPPLMLTDHDTRGCPEQSPSEPVNEIVTASNYEHQYEGDPILEPVYKAVVRMGQAYQAIKDVIASLGFCKDCTASGGYSWFANFHFLTPHAEVTAENFAVNKNNERKGWGLTFLPGRFNKVNYVNAGTLDNEVAHPKLGNQERSSLDAPFEGVKTDFNMANAVLCSITPLELQGKANIHCAGLIGTPSDNEVTPDRSLSGGTDPNFPASSLGSVNSAIANATSGEIPACVLEGVKYIETGTRTDFSGTCSVNACSAAGPFQVTTGAAPAVGGGWDTHCTQCGPSWADGSRTCPDGWPGNWPQTASDPSPCSDVDAAAARAVQMLQEKATIRCETLDNRAPADQREAIITAGNSYFGSSESISRLDGCAYGEFVYKHCDSSYVCGTANVDLNAKYTQCQQQKGL